MFDTIILLMDVAERCVIGSVLQAYNPLLTLIPVGSSAELAELTTDVLERARLISFVTAIIVPQNILARLGYGAFNFHPGPPRDPGWALSHFARCRGRDRVRRDCPRHGREGGCGADH